MRNRKIETIQCILKRDSQIRVQIIVSSFEESMPENVEESRDGDADESFFALLLNTNDEFQISWFTIHVRFA